MIISKNAIGGLMYLHTDTNLLAYMGKKKTLVRILATTESGAVSAYEKVDDPTDTFNPLIENGKNVEIFELLGEQLALF